MSGHKESGKSVPNMHRMRVTRCEHGERHTVRFVSPELLGWNTHYKNKRSTFCRGEDCASATHCINPTWKGYACAHVWSDTHGLWIPTVVEVTEHAELDMREKYARGQMWTLVCSRRTKERPRPPVLAEYLGVTPDELPQPWSMQATLVLVYHEVPPAVMVPSPLPARTMVAMVQGTAPPCAVGVIRNTAKESRLPFDKVPEDFKKMREKLALSTALPEDVKHTPSKNGDH